MSTKWLSTLAGGMVAFALFAAVDKLSTAQKVINSTLPQHVDLKETFCGSETCPHQVLVKLAGCPSNEKMNRVVHDLTKVGRVATKDRKLKIDQVGSGCLFRFHSSKLSVEQLMTVLTSLETSLVSVEKTHSKQSRLDKLRVEYLEPDFRITFDSTQSERVVKTIPNDDYFVRGELWGLSNKTYPGIDIDAIPAWNYSQGSDQLVVGVLDSGTYYNHPDLADNVWTAPRRFTIRLAGQTIRCRKGTHGYNALGRTRREKCNPDDDYGHGTLVSGIIGAKGNNTIGVVGVNWKVKLLALRIGNSKGTCVSNAINAIDFAIQLKERFPREANIRVLNNSWGFLLPTTCPIPRSLRDKIVEAGEHDMLVVCSAGENGGNDNDAVPHFPSGFDLPNVLSVTAIQQDGQLNSDLDNQANHGKKSVQLGAPGGIMWSTYIEPRQYYLGSQTSMAAPFVSGAAALILSVPGCAKLHTQDLRNLIMQGTLRTPSLGETATGGRLNVYNSIQLCVDKR